MLHYFVDGDKFAINYLCFLHACMQSIKYSYSSNTAPAPFELMDCDTCKVTFTKYGNPMYAIKLKVRNQIACGVTPWAVSIHLRKCHMHCLMFSSNAIHGR